MKTAQLLFFLLVITLQGLAQRDFSDMTPEIARSESERRGKFAGMKSGVESNVDIFYVDASWQVNPAQRFISGTVIHHFKVKEALTEVSFDLHSDLGVSRVELDDSQVAISRSGNKIIISGVFVPQASYKVRIVYSGTPPASGSGSFEARTHEGVPILWTLSEPYGAFEWWPCRQNLSDKIDSIDIHVSVPRGNKAASNGLLTAVTDPGLGREEYHWKHRYPIATYLVAIGVTNYVEYTDSVDLRMGRLPVQNMVYPETAEPTMGYTKQVLRHLQIFDSLFTPYPFMKEKYGHAQFGWGGGMEHQTMSFMGNFHYELQAHELGHQWFGNSTTCAAWEDIWLNEGFATYLTGLTYNVDFPDLYWPVWLKNNISSVTSKPNGSVYVKDVSNVARIFDSRLTYSKGAMVLHMLRWTIGDEAFFRGARNYLTNKSLQYDFATTADLQASMEDASGRDLDYFFSDWVYGEGYPSYQLYWTSTGGIFTLKVNQVQSHNSVGFFEMPLSIRLKNAERDTLLRLDNTFNGQSYVADIGFTADSLFFDPNQWIVSKSNLVKKLNVDLRSEILLFPNPAADILNIRFLQSAPQQNPVEIVDVLGRKIAASVKSQSPDLVQVDVSSLSQGMYVICLDYRGERMTLPFVR
jgi:aminopeptidase N